MTFAEAYLTSSKESEQIEDRLADVWRQPMVSASDFRPIDELLTTLVARHDQWETLYQLRL